MLTSAEGIERAETLSAVLNNFDPCALQRLSNVATVIGDAVDVGNHNGLGLRGDASLDVLNIGHEGAQANLNGDGHAAMLRDDLDHVWDVHASHENLRVLGVLSSLEVHVQAGADTQGAQSFLIFGDVWEVRVEFLLEGWSLGLCHREAIVDCLGKFLA